MRDCCLQYEKILTLIDEITNGNPHLTGKLQEVRTFVEGEYRRHVDEVGEADAL